MKKEMVDYLWYGLFCFAWVFAEVGLFNLVGIDYHHGWMKFWYYVIGIMPYFIKSTHDTIKRLKKMYIDLDIINN